jgi:hypothetical protein
MERAAVFAGACFSSPSVGDPAMPTEFTVPRRVFRAAWTVLSVTLFCEALNQPGGTENEEVPPQLLADQVPKRMQGQCDEW